MNTHTPGPWQLSHEEEGIPFVFSSNPRPSSFMGHRSDLIALPYSCAGGTQAANARLIACAPCLLDALEAITQAAEVRGDGAFRAQFNAARSVIARARGTG